MQWAPQIVDADGQEVKQDVDTVELHDLRAAFWVPRQVAQREGGKLCEGAIRARCEQVNNRLHEPRLAQLQLDRLRPCRKVAHCRQRMLHNLQHIALD